MPILLFGEVHYSSRTVQGVFFLDCVTLEDTLRFSETSGGTHLTTQYHTPDNLNTHEHRRENLILSYFYCNIQIVALYTEYHYYSTLIHDY